MKGKLIFIAVCILVIVVCKALTVLINWRNRRAAQGPGPLVPAEAAARRAGCLSAMIARAEMECVFPMADALAKAEPSRAGEIERRTNGGRDGLNRWLRDEGLWRDLSAHERKILSRGPGRWSEQDVKDASWRRESAGTIAWALGLVRTLPAWDTEFGENVPKMAGGSRFATTLQRLSPRPEAEIRQARDMAELWLWRARTTQLMRDRPDTPLPPGMTFEKIIGMTIEKAEREGCFEPIGGDFPAFGKAYRDLTDDEWSTMHSIAIERLRALNWLCGYARNWDDVRCDT